jgi:hypothetical protein
VSNQIRQKQESVSNRLMNKLGSFLGSTRRPSEALSNRASMTARPSDIAQPRSSSMFSRLLSRDMDNAGMILREFIAVHCDNYA